MSNNEIPGMLRSISFAEFQAGVPQRDGLSKVQPGQQRRVRALLADKDPLDVIEAKVRVEVVEGELIKGYRRIGMTCLANGVVEIVFHNAENDMFYDKPNGAGLGYFVGPEQRFAANEAWLFDQIVNGYQLENAGY